MILHLIQWCNAVSRPACRAATRQARNGSKGNKGWDLLTCELLFCSLSSLRAGASTPRQMPSLKRMLRALMPAKATRQTALETQVINECSELCMAATLLHRTMFGSATVLIMTPPCLHSLLGCFFQAMLTVMVNGWRTGPQGGRPVPVLLDAETGAPLQPEDIPLCLSRLKISHTPPSMAELSRVARIGAVLRANGGFCRSSILRSLTGCSTSSTSTRPSRCALINPVWTAVLNCHAQSRTVGNSDIAPDTAVYCPACRAATRQARNGSKGNKGWDLPTCELSFCSFSSLRAGASTPRQMPSLKQMLRALMPAKATRQTAVEAQVSSTNAANYVWQLHQCIERCLAPQLC